MIKKFTYDGLTWVDMESPTQEEARGIIEEYNIDAIVAHEIVTPSLRPKVDVYQSFIYLTLHFPAIRQSHTRGMNQEVDFIIGKKFLITVRYDAIDTIEQFAKSFEVNSILKKTDIGDHAGHLFFHLIRNFYHSLIDELESIKDGLREAEKLVFSGKEKEMVTALSGINRSILAFKEATRVHKDVLDSFEVAGKKFFGEDFIYHLRNIIGEYYEVNSHIESNKEYLDELRDTNNALLSTKQNEVMKSLTVISFIFLPITFLTALFGISSNYVPLLGDPLGFYQILGLSALISLVIYFYFKTKHWL